MSTAAMGFAYSPFSEEARRDPFPIYQALRDSDPVHYIAAHDGWALARFADVWVAAEDAEHFVTRSGTTAAQVLSRVDPPVPSVNQLDGADHTRLRKALHPFFARHRVAQLEGEVRALARGRLASARGGELDAARELAEPVAAHVACRLLDLPQEEAPRFQRWVARYMSNAPDDLGRSPDALSAAFEMNAWLAERVKERRAERARDGARVVDRFLEARVAGRPLGDLEIASHLQTLVIGGTETTPKVVAAALLRLHQNPAQRDAILAGRASAGDAFEEALRLDVPTQLMARTVARDCELRGRRLRAGQGVLLLYASANRDEREFPEPERFDVLRRPKRTLGFGHGAHLCIGLHMARLEGRVLVEEVLAHAPRYVALEARVVRSASDQMRGIASLPLALRGGDRTAPRVVAGEQETSPLVS